jgi:transposase
MSDFKQIIQLRNSGKTQDEIAHILCISRRSVIRYLKSGSIPVYSRETKSNRRDPLEQFLPQVKSKIGKTRLNLNDLFEYLKSIGYQGSLRTLRRKTRDLRLAAKNNEVFFQREVLPGEVAEGDFTEIQIEIAGIRRKIYLWVCSLPYSNTYFATPYFNCNFECFADGTVKAFNEFGGVPKKYRLDNFSPAVKEILSGRKRLVTVKYSELQNHYGFAQDFCNPARGNEKGNVEANNRFLKNKIYSVINLTNQKFLTLESFEKFIATICREHNKEVSDKFSEEQSSLHPLPASPFLCFRTEVVTINKYSLFGIDKSGHLYSAPSNFLGLTLEARIYPDSVGLIKDGEIICKHKRIYGQRGLVSIMPEHIVQALVKKPGAMASWKHRHILFERPAWKSFYEKMIQKGGADKDYLKCLGLITKYGRDIVTIAMELAMAEDIKLNHKELKKIIINQMDNIHEFKPLKSNLSQYDFFLKGENNGSGP